MRASKTKETLVKTFLPLASLVLLLGAASTSAAPASNVVETTRVIAGDTNGGPDAFLRRLR